MPKYKLSTQLSSSYPKLCSTSQVAEQKSRVFQGTQNGYWTIFNQGSILFLNLPPPFFFLITTVVKIERLSVTGSSGVSSNEGMLVTA